MIYRYRIHIKLGEQVITFSTNEFQRKDGKIYFIDKYGQPKEFSDTRDVVIGIEDTNKVNAEYSGDDYDG